MQTQEHLQLIELFQWQFLVEFRTLDAKHEPLGKERFPTRSTLRKQRLRADRELKLSDNSKMYDIGSTSVIV